MASSFGTYLRSLRQGAGLTIEELSHASGVSVRAIGDMERGVSRGPQRRTVLALAGALTLDEAQQAELADAARAGRPRRTVGQAPEALTSSGLPHGLADFVGRTAELDLVRERGRTASADGPPPVVVLHGAGGLGKTACAVRAAELLSEDFPDGRLYVDLRGVDPEPLPAKEALRRLLRAAGLDPRAIAEDAQERAGQLRAVLAERRCLVVLDNAADEAQVRPLLPGQGAGMVLVTSRRALSGLEGVTRVPLAPFSREESARLLAALAHQGADEPEPGTARVAELCGHLPLALRIAGTRLASRPGWTMGHLAERLSDEDLRLAHLTDGDVGVEAAFALSYVALPEQARACFRRLALVPSVDFGVPVAAVLTEADPFDAEDQLDELVELGLLQHEGADRYRFHDLIRLYAARRLGEEEADEAREAAARRMTDWLLETATVAGRWFDGDTDGDDARPDGAGLVALTSPDDARTWLLVEKESWLAALRLAAAAGRDEQVARFGEAMNWIANETQVWANDWLEVFGLTRTAAARLPDRRREIWHRIRHVWALLTIAAQRRDDDALRESAGLAMDTYRLAEQVGAVKEQAEAVCNAAEAWRILHDDDQALWAYHRGRELAETADDQSTYFWASGGLVVGLGQAGRFDEAVDAYRAMLKAVAAQPVPSAAAETTRSFALARLVTILADAERYDAVVAIVEPALAEFVEEGNNWTPLMHWAAGRAYAGLGANATAREHLTLALGQGEAQGRWKPQPGFLDRVTAMIAALDAETAP